MKSRNHEFFSWCRRLWTSFAKTRASLQSNLWPLVQRMSLSIASSQSWLTTRLTLLLSLMQRQQTSTELQLRRPQLRLPYLLLLLLQWQLQLRSPHPLLPLRPVDASLLLHWLKKFVSPLSLGHLRVNTHAHSLLSFHFQLASDAGVDLATLGPLGTGPGGRVVAADVREFVASAAARPTAAAASASPASAPTAVEPSLATAGASGTFVDIPHTQMRRVIAQRLTLSKQTVPHYTLTSDVRLDALLALRR